MVRNGYLTSQRVIPHMSKSRILFHSTAKGKLKAISLGVPSEDIIRDKSLHLLFMAAAELKEIAEKIQEDVLTLDA